MFVEVKYRKQGRFGSASEAIDEKKKNLLYETATSYLLENNLSLDTQCLFSAVLIDESAFTRNIRLIENIFI